MYLIIEGNVRAVLQTRDLVCGLKISKTFIKKKLIHFYLHIYAYYCLPGK